MTSELIRYINQYGGFCRDCADNDGICPTSGMPCDPKSTNAVIKHTLAALEYGIKHGFIENPFARTAPIVPELVQQKPTDERCLETELEVAELKLAELEMQLELKTDECAQLANSLEGSEHLRKAAEAKLAEYEKQKPFGYLLGGVLVFGHEGHALGDFLKRATPLYASPAPMKEED